MIELSDTVVNYLANPQHEEHDRLIEIVARCYSSNDALVPVAESLGLDKENIEFEKAASGTWRNVVKALDNKLRLVHLIPKIHANDDFKKYHAQLSSLVRRAELLTELSFLPLTEERFEEHVAAALQAIRNPLESAPTTIAEAIRGLAQLQDRSRVHAFLEALAGRLSKGGHRERLQQWLAAHAPPGACEAHCGDDQVSLMVQIVQPVHSDSTYHVTAWGLGVPGASWPAATAKGLLALRQEVRRIYEAFHELLVDRPGTSQFLIEFIVEYHLLKEPFHSWEFGSAPLSDMHHVVVRSYERSVKAQYRNLLRDKWDRHGMPACPAVPAGPDGPPNVCGVGAIESIRSATPGDLFDSNLACVLIPERPKAGVQAKKEYLRLLAGGVPAVLWTSDAQGHLTCTGGQALEIVDRVFRARRQGRVLVLLWDDPNRKIPATPRLHSPFSKD